LTAIENDLDNPNPANLSKNQSRLVELDTKIASTANLEITSFSPQKLIEQSLRGNGLDHEGITTTIQTDEHSSAINTRRSALAMIFNQILQNFQRIYSEGSIEDPQISFAVTTEDGQVVIIITNNFGQINLGDLDICATNQVLQAGVSSGNGGQGLSIADNLAQVLGGNIAVDNTADGVRFKLRIPNLA
jgi:signal transduction histidine kinase